VLVNAAVYGDGKGWVVDMEVGSGLYTVMSGLDTVMSRLHL
jgi:hypothetical protein